MPTKSNEWYTPHSYIQAVKEVLGGIDLDPASCAEANQTVGARYFYDKEDDGLAQPWYRRVYLNPPYSLEGAARGMEPGRVKKAVMTYWIEKLIEEYRLGRVDQAILLSKADPKQLWFQSLWDYPICFVRSRLLFNRPGLPPEKHQFGNVFVYFGRDQDKFLEVFTQFGPVVTPDGVHRKAS
jgi:ParB family chromosome partitioning protein